MFVCLSVCLLFILLSLFAYKALMPATKNTIHTYSVTYRKSHPGFSLVPKLVTFNDLERRIMTSYFALFRRIR